ncbi:hypothetical protein LINPERHAP2_LOCUS31220 [Linum perenne]
MCSLVLFHVLLVLLVATHFGNDTSVVVVGATRPLVASSSNDANYATLKTPPPTVLVGGRKGKVGRGRGSHKGERVFVSCLPKGFHRNSAPSRYINYDPLGASTTTACDTVEKKH